MSNKFKSSTGGYYTRQLFYEEWMDLPIEKRAIDPLFSLYKERPGVVYMGKVYVDCRDPSGYKVAQKLLDGDYTLWTVLLNCRWFQAAKEVWDRELDAALVSEGMDAIREMAREGLPAQKLAAAKFLATKSYRKDASASKGRPRKEDVSRAAKELAATEKEILDDMERIKRGHGS